MKKNTITNIDDYSYGWHNNDSLYGKNAKRGLTKETIIAISAQKKEPKWMLDVRLKAFEVFNKLKMPEFGPNLQDINFEQIKYFVRSTDKTATSWDSVPKDIKDTYNKLGIIKAEQERLIAGVAAQYESEVVYHQIQKNLKDKGVIFLSTDQALQEYPEIFKEYFMSVVSMNDNKFAALNTAVWSGGSFIYVPKGVVVDIPLQAYFRINTENMGQFERTLIIADSGSFVHYVEGCTAPIYSTDSLHSAVVEIVVKKDARVRYSTIQNWSNNVYNLVTKRARVLENGIMQWVDGNIGSKVSMKYPACILDGENAKGEVMSLSFAAGVQNQDTGARIIHNAKNTASTIIAKSISRNGGTATYRGAVKVLENAANSKSTVQCDSLLLDDFSAANAVPTTDAKNEFVHLGHEATVSKVNKEQLFYLQQRGISEKEAIAMIVRGFIDPISKELPMEYAVELNRLISLQMDGSVG